MIWGFMTQDWSICSAIPQRMTTSDKTFVCDCEQWMRSACPREVLYKKIGTKSYCVLHYPDKDKKELFKRVLDRKIKAQDFDFSGVWFPQDIDFSDLTMTKVSFRKAILKVHVRFNKTKFISKADFRGAEFVYVDFSGAQFMEVDFKDAHFKRALFFKARFAGDAHFNPAQFATRAEFAGAEFCGRANFGNARLIEAYFANAKFANVADFGRVEFAGPNFSKTQFSGLANFAEATFSGTPIFKTAHFVETNFSKAKFNTGAAFEDVTFRGDADFNAASFSAATTFNNTEFERKAFFNGTEFGLTSVSNGESGPITTGEGQNKKVVLFTNSTFKDRVVFENNAFAPDVTLRFNGTVFEHANRVMFHNLNLRPMWFIGVDSRGLQFINVRWRKLRSPKLISGEIRTLEDQGVVAAYESLEIACRQLAANAEENSRYEEAARFRLIANAAKRKKSWRNLTARPGKWESWSNLNPLLWLYGLLSGYGERVMQAAFVLVGIALIFALLFYVGQRKEGWWQPRQEDPKLSVQQAAKLRDFREAVIYSLNVMALQKPSPAPDAAVARVLVLLETVLGPLQAALLALAIRRKFMR
jgi:uncharacterized protein YjbI with pentapeptide repeats